jgi:hypothetical protein
MSLELETLDQLLGGDLPLSVIRGLYPDDKSFVVAIHALLCCGDVRLFSVDGADVPAWRWRELFDAGGFKREMHRLRLDVTHQGAGRVS